MRRRCDPEGPEKQRGNKVSLGTEGEAKELQERAEAAGTRGVPPPRRSCLLYLHPPEQEEVRRSKEMPSPSRMAVERRGGGWGPAGAGGMLSWQDG